MPANDEGIVDDDDDSDSDQEMQHSKVEKVIKKKHNTESGVKEVIESKPQKKNEPAFVDPFFR